VTPLGLVPLRRAATVVHALPGVRLRLRVDGRTILSVARPPLPEGPAVTPCAFRASVARAHLQLREGHRLQFLGMAEGATPGIEVGTRPGDAVHPGPIYEVAVAGGVVLAFATTLGPRACREAFGELGELGAIGEPELRLHHDAATDVTLVHVVGGDGATTDAHRLILESLLARCAAEEVASELSAIGAAAG
jgi:hypothetical protein